MGAATINAFFSEANLPLRNSRGSWGATDGRTVMLCTWADQLSASGQFVCVLGAPGKWTPENSFGRLERIKHLQQMWSGTVAGYAVLAKADKKSSKRRIASLGSEIHEILSLRADHDLSIWAELGAPVEVAQLRQHSAKHQVSAGNGPPPFQLPSHSPKRSDAAYIAKLPAIRHWLIEVAKGGKSVTYADARAPFGLKTFEHRHAMERIGHECLERHEPILTALIVDDLTGRCNPGFGKAFHRDDEVERKECYAYWSTKDGEAWAGESGPIQKAEDLTQENEGLEARAIQFAKVATRPDQARFRKKVFRYWGGRCAVTGCTAEVALDAAHLEGRDWKKGHNRGRDGVLLRKDIHALYDRKILTISADGLVQVRTEDKAYAEYVQFSGRQLSKPLF